MESYVKWATLWAKTIRGRCVAKTTRFPSMAAIMQQLNDLADLVEKANFSPEGNARAYAALGTPELAGIWQEVYGNFVEVSASIEKLLSMDKLIETAVQGLYAMEDLNDLVRTPRAGAGGP